VVVVGETGSGKTTQIPQFVADASLLRGSGLVGVTQPRRVAATSVARRVAEERGGKVGDHVGYTIRFEDKTSASTRIKFMTDGTLVRECLADPSLRRYSCLMLDEAHERSIHTDILFGLVKKALRTRRARDDLRVVITSATLDVERFAAYFNDCPVVAVPGRLHDVDIYHSKTKQVMTAHGPSTNAYVQDAVDLVLKLHRSQPAGSILLFLTGQEEIDRACRMLIEEDQHAGDLILETIPLYGSLSGEAQSRAFAKSAKGERIRKVIVATNIAETSVTVPDVRYVVDPGFVKQTTYNPERGMEALVVVPISKVSAQQRAGRAGRTSAGQCYRLYSKECYASMMQETVPEIKRSSLSSTVLYLKALGITDVLGFEYFESPDHDQLEEALLLLFCLGALNTRGAITECGLDMSKFPVEPQLARMLLRSADEGCVQEAVIIAAMLSTEPIWYSRSRNGQKDEEAEAKHASFNHRLGDHLTLLNVWRRWESDGRMHDSWPRENFLRVRSLRTARSIHTQLHGEMAKNHIPVTSCGNDSALVSRAVCAGFFANSARRIGNESAYKLLPRPSESGAIANGGLSQLIYPHPTSVFAQLNQAPPFVVFHQIVATARPFMRHILAVDHSVLVKARSPLETMITTQELCGFEPPTTRASAEATESYTSALPSKPQSLQASSGGNHKAQAIAEARARFLARKKSAKT